MPGLDSLLAKTLTTTVRENLGERTLQKIEQRVFERFGINLTQAIEDFAKLDSVLQEFFGSGAEGLERQFMNGIVSLETLENQKEWITIQDPRLATVILKALADDDKNKILNVVLEKPMIISDILFMCQIPNTSGYRKINSLIEDGLLVTEGHERLNDSKIVTRYKTLFENVHIDILQNKVTIKVQVSETSLKSSSLIPLVCSR